MSNWSIFFAIYLATTGIALVLTYREHRRSGARSVVLELASLLACTLWPVVAVLCLFSKSPSEVRNDL